MPLFYLLISVSALLLTLPLIAAYFFTQAYTFNLLIGKDAPYRRMSYSGKVKAYIPIIFGSLFLFFMGLIIWVGLANLLPTQLQKLIESNVVGILLKPAEIASDIYFYLLRPDVGLAALPFYIGYFFMLAHIIVQLLFSNRIYKASVGKTWWQIILSSFLGYIAAMVVKSIIFLFFEIITMLF